MMCRSPGKILMATALVTVIAVIGGCIVLVDSVGAASKRTRHSDGAVTETIEKTIPVSGRGSLTAETINGRIAVSSWDRPEIHLTAEKRVRFNKSGRVWILFIPLPRLSAPSAEELEEYLDKVKVDVDVDGSDVRIVARYPKKPRNISYSVQYELRVPVDIDLDLETVNGAIEIAEIDGEVTAETTNGKISCENVDGSMELSTTNGSILCEDVSGHLSADTTNGSIEAVYTSPTLPQDGIRCETVNGSVELSLPEGASFELDVSTVNGKIRTEFPVTVQGEISRKHLRGTVGDGGPPVSLETVNGSITVDRL